MSGAVLTGTRPTTSSVTGDTTSSHSEPAGRSHRLPTRNASRVITISSVARSVTDRQESGVGCRCRCHPVAPRPRTTRDDPMTDTQPRELPSIDFDFPPEALASTNLTEILSIKNQAPRMSATAAWNLAELAHAVPCATTPRRASRVGPGDPAPDFSLESTAGGTVSLGDLRGQPTVLVLARAMRTGGFCPISTGTMDDLRTSHDAYREAGVHLVVVAATNVDEARGM